MRTRLDFFNERAAGWGRDWDVVGMQKRLHEEVQSFDLTGSETVLDLGCGTGILLEVLLEQMQPDCTIHAVDFSHEMLKQARRRFTDSRLVFHQADAASIPLEDGILNDLFCFSTFPHFVQPDDVLREGWRLLAPGGRFYVWHHESSKRLNEMHATVDPAVASDYLEPANELRLRFEKIGYDIMSCQEDDHTYFISARKPF